MLLLFESRVGKLLKLKLDNIYCKDSSYVYRVRTPNYPKNNVNLVKTKICYFRSAKTLLVKLKKIPSKLYRFSLLVVIFVRKTRSEEKVNYCTLHHAKNNAQCVARSKMSIEMERGICFLSKIWSP